NLKDDTDLDILWRYARKHPSLIFKEFLFTPQNSFIKDIYGNSYTNEVLIPLKNDVSPKKEALFPPLAKSHSRYASYFDWLYFKVYGGVRNLEHILTNELLQTILFKQAAHLYQKFFFIRYGDPDNHIRLRFKCESRSSQSTLQAVLIELFEKHMKSGYINTYKLELYEPEYDRYGYDLMEEAESIFHFDSLFCLKTLKLQYDSKNEYALYLLAIRSIDQLLNDFGLTVEQKFTLLQHLQRYYFEEFGGQTTLLKLLNNKYRLSKNEINDFMTSNVSNDSSIKT